MKIIGLTGGIACGKSTVSAYLKQKGAFIIDGDAIARQLSEPKKSIWQAYVNHFGDKVLNEANWDKFADEVWVVKISRQLQIERIQNRDGLTKEEAISRIDAQMSLEEKAKRADVVIDSSNAPEVTLQLVEKIWNERLL